MTTTEAILALVATEDRMRAINLECGLSEFAHRFLDADEWVAAVDRAKRAERIKAVLEASGRAS